MKNIKKTSLRYTFVRATDFVEFSLIAFLTGILIGMITASIYFTK